MKSEAQPWHLAEVSPAFLLAEEAAYWVLAKKGEDLLVLDLRGKSDVCDFFLICSGLADVQVRAIASSVQEGLGSSGHKLLHTEGLEKARWALLDYVDLVVHVFLPETRNYYLLERLWGDAPCVAIATDYFQTAAVRKRHPDLLGVPSGSTAADTQDSEE